MPTLVACSAVLCLPLLLTVASCGVNALFVACALLCVCIFPVCCAFPFRLPKGVRWLCLPVGLLPTVGIVLAVIPELGVWRTPFFTAVLLGGIACMAFGGRVLLQNTAVVLLSATVIACAFCPFGEVAFPPVTALWARYGCAVALLCPFVGGCALAAVRRQAFCTRGALPCALGALGGVGLATAVALLPLFWECPFWESGALLLSAPLFCAVSMRLACNKTA